MEKFLLCLAGENFFFLQATEVLEARNLDEESKEICIDKGMISYVQKRQRTKKWEIFSPQDEYEIQEHPKASPFSTRHLI